MSLVAVRDLSLSYGSKTLFEGASFAIGPNERVGLVGANGTGKSTLLKILAGNIVADSGELNFRKRARIGYLPQELTHFSGEPLLQAVLSAVPGRADLEARLREVEDRMAHSAVEVEQLELSQQLAELTEEWTHFDERFGRHQAERILQGLGFAGEHFERSVNGFSGGWRMRAALAGLLLQDPDLLLLDEPTNHLDLPTLSWFEGFLRQSKKARVLISHDREFLNRQIDRVLSLELEGLRAYPGDYENYRVLRAAEWQQLQAKAERQAAQRAETEAFIERFKAKASKARQVQSRIKMLEKEEQIQVLEERKHLEFSFPEVARSGREVAGFRDVRRAFGEYVVYDKLNATLFRGQRVAVVGVNGAGKTTLLKLLARELVPEAGEVWLGPNVVMGYYAQHHAESLDPRLTILEEVGKAAPEKTPGQIRNTLGAFLFSGDDVDKRIAVLSGGERARVALAKLLLKPANFLMMDEPTNHLDLDSSEALIRALQSYSGTLLFVSHNKSFINQLATEVWDVADRRVTPFPGNLTDYWYHLEQNAHAVSAEKFSGRSEEASRGPSEKERKRIEAEARQRKSALEGPIKKEIASLEKQIAHFEQIQQEHEQKLANPDIYEDFSKARGLTEELQRAQKELKRLFEQWETAHSRLENLEKEG